MRKTRMRRAGSSLVVAGLAGLLVLAMIQPGGATPPVDATSVSLGQGAVLHDAAADMVKGDDVAMAQNTFAPGGSSGWHSHPGTAVIVVQSGEITISKVKTGGDLTCFTRTYHAGSSFIERPGWKQNGVNNGSEDAVVAVVFFGVPHGESARIDRTDPGTCSG